MWYVIQTMVGHERVLTEKIKARVNAATYNSCFLIEAESMRRREGKQHICIEVLFPSYVFVDTYTPRLFYEELKNVSDFTKLLAEMDKVDDDSFFPITIEEQLFLETIMDEDHVVRLSLVEKNRNNRVGIVEGPLLYYKNEIISLDYRHRRALAEIKFNEEWKRVRFGLCTEQDLIDNDMPERLEVYKANKQEIANVNPYENLDKWDWKSRQKIDKLLNLEQKENEAEQKHIGDIYIGTWVVINSGIYGNKEFQVTSINTGKNAIGIEVEMFGSRLEIEVGIDEVTVV